MNDQRLRFDLADLADEVTPVDLRDRALRTSRRLGIQRAVATSAAAVVMLGAATGTAFALMPRTDGQAPTPADSPSITQTPVEVTPTPTSGSASEVSPVARPTEARSSQWPQVTWYSNQEYGGKQNDPARIWRGVPGGKWKLIREGLPGNRTSNSAVVASPDGARAAWMEARPSRMVIGRFEGGGVHTVPVQGERTCAPRWLDSGRVLFAQGRNLDLTVVAVNADGTGRRVLATHQPACPVVADGWFGQFGARTVGLQKESGTQRGVTPRIPAGLKIHAVPGIAADGRTIVISTHVPNAGECGCTWRIRNYRVDTTSGDATELAPLDPAWRKATGHGRAERVLFLADGGLVAQVDVATAGDDAPDYLLVRYAANGRVLASAAVPAGNPWGDLLG
jgi:hypothetical protein